MTRNKLFVFLLLPLLFSACSKKTAVNNDEPRKVRGAVVEFRELPDETEGFGTLSFLSKVDIASPQDGVIRRLYFREGDFVRQGAQALLLENPQIRLAVERAENNYSQALAARELARSRLLEGRFQAEAQLLSIEKSEAELIQYKRKWEEDKRRHLNQESLFEAGGINTETILAGRFSLDSEWEQILIMERELDIRKIGCRQQDLLSAGLFVPEDDIELRDALVTLMTSSLKAELDAAEAQLEAAGKELASARVALADLDVRSPASGVVGARYVEQGERVKAEDRILSLMDTASLYAIFPVREKDAVRIEKGLKASVLIDGTGEYRDGVVDLVYPQADSQSLSFLVRVLLLNAPGNDRLKPGMFARVCVTLGPPQRTILVPESAIFNIKDREGSVFIINGSVLVQRKIVMGQVFGEEREIVSGLNAGDLIVLRPENDLREGAYVELDE